MISAFRYVAYSNRVPLVQKHRPNLPMNLGNLIYVNLTLCVMPNTQHQRPEPAAIEQRVQHGQNGWLRSAECC
jgi:hypothetical protein